MNENIRQMEDKAENIEKVNRLQHLIAAVNADCIKLPEKMQLSTGAVIINQCSVNRYDRYEVDGNIIECYSYNEKGVGRSRNSALMHASGEFLLISDEDIVYKPGYVEAIIAQFDENPDADMILFNIDQSEGRETYHNDSYRRVTWRNYGRYPAYSICMRKTSYMKANVMFSLLFGGGAPYSAGEDSLFLHDCLKSDMKIFCSPVVIGHEIARKSTWFEGYNEKYFLDRGTLYRYLYGKAAPIMGVRFVLKHRRELCKRLSAGQCIRLIKDGIRRG